jgi:hypothetical protein
MSYLNKLLIVIYICLTLTYAFDIFEQKGNIDTIIPQLIMLAFVNIAIVAAFFSKQWFGQLLLYTNFLLVGLIPLVLGIISLWVTDQRIKELFKYTCAGVPILLIVFPIVSYLQGGMGNDWEPNIRFVVYRLVQAIYWYTVFMYTSTHLKPELEKILKSS